MPLQTAKAGLVVGKVLLSVDFDPFLAEALPVGPLLIDHPVEAAEVRLAIVATTTWAHARKRLLSAERRLVVVRLSLHMVVGGVEKPDQPVNLVRASLRSRPMAWKICSGQTSVLK